MDKARVHKIREVHAGKVFKLLQEELTLPNGFSTCLEIIRHPGAAAVVAFQEKGNVLLLRQYRHAVQAHIWEIPAGTLSAGEEPLECARRELAEETGYLASEFHFLGETIPVPGYSDERVYIFLAKGLISSQQHLDQDEVLEVHSVPFEQALGMVQAGQIQDAKTIVGLTLARMALDAGNSSY